MIGIFLGSIYSIYSPFDLLSPLKLLKSLSNYEAVVGTCINDFLAFYTASLLEISSI